VVKQFLYELLCIIGRHHKIMKAWMYVLSLYLFRSYDKFSLLIISCHDIAVCLLTAITLIVKPNDMEWSHREADSRSAG
jgi:hypothetical protein